jgi:hypothetical protein
LRLVQLFHALINSDNFVAPSSGLQKKCTIFKVSSKDEPSVREPKSDARTHRTPKAIAKQQAFRHGLLAQALAVTITLPRGNGGSASSEDDGGGTAEGAIFAGGAAFTLANLSKRIIAGSASPQNAKSGSD